MHMHMDMHMYVHVHTAVAITKTVKPIARPKWELPAVSVLVATCGGQV